MKAGCFLLRVLRAIRGSIVRSSSVPPCVLGDLCAEMGLGVMRCGRQWETPPASAHPGAFLFDGAQGAPAGEEEIRLARRSARGILPVVGRWGHLYSHRQWVGGFITCSRR